jgi:actin-related protein 10
VNWFRHWDVLAMSAYPSTPRTPTGPAPVAATTTPTNTRVSASHTSHIQASPAYTTTRRHSLYGVEDRIVIDPGSHIWKVGFSGEGKPRDVFLTAGKGATRDKQELWKLARARDPREREEEERLLAISLERCLRSVFHEYVYS